MIKKKRQKVISKYIMKEMTNKKRKQNIKKK